MKRQIVSILIEKDFETGERCGASGTFQICNVLGFDLEANEYELTEYISTGNHYLNEEEVLESIKVGCGDYDFSNCEIE